MDYLSNLLNKYDLSLDDNKLQQFLDYYNLLVEWNEKINLTAITDYKEVCLKHFLDSLSLVKMFDSLEDMCKHFTGKTLCDVGTGAGFPGIPLKILLPELRVTLFDSLDKRVRFLNEVITKLKLDGIEAVHGRAEDLARTEYRASFDYSTARAVASLPVLCEYCIPFLKEGGTFIAYKSDVDSEIQNSEHALSVLGGEIVSRENFSLSDDSETIDRSIIFIKKSGVTPDTYPRKAGKPSKQPL
ncbi:MAG: 16S rRNA (guanine(527)-N(7))-methyltransferase RsmG [Lachnospiraceae bacterium]|nr:16S rRNA (guanine(527)-N(7))-methyltransferase RsmG [Lachnospiraceae bacterium]